MPDLDPDDRLLLEPLRALGIRAEPAVWDDPAVDWARYDLAVLPMLTGPDSGVDGLYRPEDIRPRSASAAELAVAERALAAAPTDLLYARVDVIPGPDGAPVVVEVEPTEPSLYLGQAPGAVDRVAHAIVSRAAASRP